MTEGAELDLLEQVRANNRDIPSLFRKPIAPGHGITALDTQRLVAGFPKNLRFQIGDRLAWMTQDFFEATVKANFIRDAVLCCRALDALSAEIFTIRMTIRMAKDLKTISSGQYTEVNARIEDLHKQLTGWTK